MRSELLDSDVALNVENVRKDFPILNISVHDKKLVYLDNAATTQKPTPVIEKERGFYLNTNSNIHRGVHHLSQKATEEYENARKIIQKFIGARESEEIIFTRGATESFNLIAYSYGLRNFKPGDEVMISAMEHHANIVPWQLIRDLTGIVLRVIPMDERGVLQMDTFYKLLNEKTKFVSVVHVSNSLGTINPVKEIIDAAHSHNIPVMIDGAQSIQHIPINVLELDCDFFAFSGHKIYGPTGTGVLYGKREFLDKMSPFQGGGDMIRSVSFEETTFNDLPYKFEAGTPNIAGAIGLGEAIKYVQKIGLNNIAALESELMDYATRKLSAIDGLRIIGTSPDKAGAISFVLENVHPHDVGTMLDFDGIAVRTGHHCTEPVMKHFGIPATTRASFSFYNTKEEIDILCDSIVKTIKMFE